MKRQGLALTYDDVRLKTGYARVMPDDVDVSSSFSRNVSLKVPLVSAPMDRVTESRLAIALAMVGGLGIIHRGLSPEDQAAEVRRVKHHLHGRIDEPVTVKASDNVENVLALRAAKGYSFETFPVVAHDGCLVGIVSGNDFDFCDDPDRRVVHIMSKDVLTAAPDTSLGEAYKIMLRSRKKVLPLVEKSGRLRGMYVWSDVKRIVTGSSADFNVDTEGRLLVGAAVGVREDAERRLELLVREGVDVLVIDSAHADSKPVVETLRWLKRRADCDVVVGNVSEGSSAARLVRAGADGIKVGQGPGSICTTRVIAGIGCPQVMAVYQCAVAVKNAVPLCADGGITQTGDIPIALGVGAASVMMGMVFAGTDESPGGVVYDDLGRLRKEYRGMGSLGAMEDSATARARYGQVRTGKGQLIPEGVEGTTEYRGKLADVVYQYVGGLRRGMGYVGAANVSELQRKADFHRISSAGQVESHPHGVQITRSSPNYAGGKQR
ncbi:MAG TPA: IMP dehydrogenase [Candidatus Nanoarchaeia archaeon]|nr:IMP dehydrogenase [Candidatus Nanoarchaeia archaeon]